MAGTRSPFLGLLPLPERQAITRACALRSSAAWSSSAQPSSR